jgi:serine/threonine-protein kinase
MTTVLPAGRTIAGYRIDGVLGNGGMGVVYRATQLALDREVALKVLAPHLSGDEEFRERFRREAMLQAALEHPGIVTVYEAGESEDGLYLALRLVDGTDLKRLVESGPLEPERALALLEQAAAALDAAHQAGLVHRDVKPQNILVDGADRAYLADFGLTKGAGDRGLTLTGAYLGSLDYVPPEQIRGEPFGAAGDLYAFAACAYEALVGEVPFRHETEAALLYAHVNEPPPRASDRRPELPPALDDVLARGLAKEPAARFRSAGELVAEARRALAGERPRRFGETVADPALLRRAPVIAIEDERRLSPALLAFAAALCAGLAVVGFLLGHHERKAPTGPDGVAVAGPLQLTFPSARWRPAPPTPLPGLPTTGAVSLASTDPSAPGSLLAGTAPRAQSARLVPDALVGDEQPQAVRLGRYPALRYANLHPKALHGETATLYALQTSAGPATIACVAPTGDTAVLAQCESIATTLVVRGANALPLGASTGYAATLRRVLTPLAKQRAQARRTLGPAAATRLADRYASARARLAVATVGPNEQPAHARLLRGLERAQSGYIALAGALQAHDRSAYLAAASKVRTGEAQADAALRSLKPLGYAPR